MPKIEKKETMKAQQEEFDGKKIVDFAERQKIVEQILKTKKLNSQLKELLGEYEKKIEPLREEFLKFKNNTKAIKSLEEYKDSLKAWEKRIDKEINKILKEYSVINTKCIDDFKNRGADASFQVKYIKGILNQKLEETEKNLEELSNDNKTIIRLPEATIRPPRSITLIESSYLEEQKYYLKSMDNELIELNNRKSELEELLDVKEKEPNTTMHDIIDIKSKLAVIKQKIDMISHEKEKSVGYSVENKFKYTHIKYENFYKRLKKILQNSEDSSELSMNIDFAIMALSAYKERFESFKDVQLDLDNVDKLNSHLEKIDKIIKALDYLKTLGLMTLAGITFDFDVKDFVKKEFGESILNTKITTGKTSKAFGTLLEKLELENIKFNFVYKHEKDISDVEIINQLSNNKSIRGYCASLALAYIGQKYFNMNVTSYRVGKSIDFFANNNNLKIIAGFVDKKFFKEETQGENGLDTGESLLKKIELNKEYYFVSCGHVAIVRKVREDEKDVLQYLELQQLSPDAGWKNFDENLRTTLKNRFMGYMNEKDVSNESFMIEIDGFVDPNSETVKNDFLYTLGYIQTM